MNQGLEATFSALIGKRVTIRLHDPEGGFRDIVGHLESPITLRNRHGKIIEFSYDKIAIWKEGDEKKSAFDSMTRHLENFNLSLQQMARQQCIAVGPRFIEMHT